MAPIFSPASARRRCPSRYGVARLPLRTALPSPVKIARACRSAGSVRLLRERHDGIWRRSGNEFAVDSQTPPLSRLPKADRPRACHAANAAAGPTHGFTCGVSKKEPRMQLWRQARRWASRGIRFRFGAASEPGTPAEHHDDVRPRIRHCASYIRARRNVFKPTQPQADNVATCGNALAAHLAAGDAISPSVVLGLRARRCRLRDPTAKSKERTWTAGRIRRLVEVRWHRAGAPRLQHCLPLPETFAQDVAELRSLKE